MFVLWKHFIKNLFEDLVMFLFVVKTVAAALLISFVSWLSGRKTHLAGFLTALPLTSLIALAFSYAEWGDSSKSVEYAKSIFTAVPLSLLFFVPFFLAEKMQISFWSCFISGLMLLFIGYLVHQMFAG